MNPPAATEYRSSSSGGCPRSRLFLFQPGLVDSDEIIETPIDGLRAGLAQIASGGDAEPQALPGHRVGHDVGIVGEINLLADGDVDRIGVAQTLAIAGADVG